MDLMLDDRLSIRPFHVAIDSDDLQIAIKATAVRVVDHCSPCTDKGDHSKGGVR